MWIILHYDNHTIIDLYKLINIFFVPIVVLCRSLKNKNAYFCIVQEKRQISLFLLAYKS